MVNAIVCFFLVLFVRRRGVARSSEDRDAEAVVQELLHGPAVLHDVASPAAGHAAPLVVDPHGAVEAVMPTANCEIKAGGNETGEPSISDGGARLTTESSFDLLAAGLAGVGVGLALGALIGSLVTLALVSRARNAGRRAGSFERANGEKALHGSV